MARRMEQATTFRRPSSRPARPAQQRGVVLVVTMIALLLLLVGAAAMLRSVDTSSVLVGNLSFRRDLTNRGEQAIVAARKALVSGALSAETTRNANLASAYYSAVKFENASSGIPKVLVSDSAFTSAGMTVADISDDDVVVRYVIDRQCTAAGEFDTRTCEVVALSGDDSGSNWLRKPGGVSRPLYRISVRVTGPRNTQAYFQTTFSY
jgi:Tfp pilus assembly protein PilX